MDSHHVSLMRSPFSLVSLFHAFADRVDPYHEFDHLPVHKGAFSPRFNVTETQTKYILAGELPGLTDKKSISVAWLHNQVLMISGTTPSADTESATDPFVAGYLQNELPLSKNHVDAPPPSQTKLEVEAMTGPDAVTYPRQLLLERRLGSFQRSFTFPEEVAADEMKACLKDGLLSIVVPKLHVAEPCQKRIQVE